MIAVGYLAVCLPYIWFSGRLAAAVAPNLHALEAIERVKGQAFVVMTAVLLFAVAFTYLRRIRDQERALLDHERSLAQTEHVAMAGILAAATCHDTNNMLMAVRGNIELVAEEPDLAPEAREGVARALTNCDRASGALRRLMDLSRASLPGKAQPERLAPLLQDVADLARRHQAVQPHLLECVVAEDLQARINARLLTGALLNLVLNAAEAMGAPGRIRMAAHDGGGTVVIEVHDAGPGVPEDLRARIVEPFFTTKPSGTGLGLLSVRACALDHGGRLEVDTSPDLGGAVFRLVLPQLSGVAAA